MQQDSIDNETLYFYGQASDDYGLRSLKLHYYPAEDESKSKKVDLQISTGTFDEFVNVFPDQLEALQRDVSAALQTLDLSHHSSVSVAAGDGAC